MTGRRAARSLAVAAVLLFLGGGGCAVGSRVQVSDGFRDGTVQKFSHRGLLFKTWEGELALDGFKLDRDGKGGSAWGFSVDASDAAVVEKLQSVRPGQRVRLHYRATLSSLPWEGNTRYRVTAVDVLN
jgi:hypothetical protein